MKLTKPLIYYVIALYIGCISYIVFSESIFIGAVIAASFLIIILATVDKKFSILIICFFITGILSTLFYYKLSVINEVETIRITKNKEYYLIGRTKGRNIYIEGSISGIKEGDKILANGKFDRRVDYSRGTIGRFYIDEFKIYKKDLVSDLYKIKRNSYDKFNKLLGEDKAALVMSLCFGETEYLTEEQKQDFQELGVIHAISVSGFHMAIIYRILEGIAGLKISLIISFVYMMFTGAQPATIRAFVMILILKLSKKVFRSYDSLSALSFSALIILTIRPFYALDLGFILSYLSTLGIILYYDKIKKALYKLPKSINESLSLTLSAQVFSMAYSGMVFNNVSFGFLLGNIILLPIYTTLVVAGNLTLIFLKVDILFNIMCKLIYFITIVIDGADYLLLRITPPVNRISYLESLGILMLIIAFILTQRGYRKFKAAPLFIVTMIMFESYTFFPEISFINLGGRDGVILNYKNERVLIHNLDENFKLINNDHAFTKIIGNPADQTKLTLGKRYSVKILCERKNGKDFFDLEVSAYDSNTIFTRSTERFMDVDLLKYDIIKLPKSSYYPFKGKLTNNLPKISYNVIFDKIYCIEK
jgi:competence protein ComEC